MYFLIHMLTAFIIAIEAFTLFPVGFVYAKFKDKKYFYALLIIIINIFEISFISYISQLAQNSAYIEYIQMSGLRLIVSLLTLFLDLNLLFSFFQKRIKKLYYLILIPYLIIELFVMDKASTEFYLWCYYAIRQLYRMLFIGLFWRFYYKEKDKEKCAEYSCFSPYVAISAILIITILIEDSLTISHISSFFAGNEPYIGRNFSEHILWLVFAYSWFKPTLRYFEEFRHSETKKTIEDISLTAFAKHYSLTPREREVLELIIQNETNDGIANKLYISSGTLKTHIHNLYAKTRVNNRIDLQRIIFKFRSEDESSK